MITGQPSVQEAVLDHRERIARIALARSAGIGPVLYFRLLARFGSARTALEALPRLVAAGRLPRVRPASPADAARELERAARLAVHVVLHGEPGYPERLRELEDPPPVVVLAGRRELLGRPSVAVVGARNASANGRAFAAELARELADAGVCVVSGLARGIDAAAHEGALAGPGSTLAVLASGIDRPYPPENAALMREIGTRGLLLSERPLGAEPRARHFPHRNRLIAALVAGVVVVEAAARSGSLMTARLALELGREVMAVPGTPLDPRHVGTNRLLREGAHLVERAEDVLAVLDSLPPASFRAHRGQRSGGTGQAPQPPPERKAAAEDAADGLEARLLAALGPEPVGLDLLVRQCGRTASEVQEALFTLELEGLIDRHPGNRVSRRSG